MKHDLDLRCILRRFAYSSLIALTVTSLCACAAASGPSFRQNTVGLELQWPPLPQVTKVAWIKEVRSYLDVGIPKSFWKQVAEFIVGADETGIGKPYGVYADDQDRLFVVDVSLAQVHLFDVRERKYTAIGAGRNLFMTPIAVTGDGQGNVYITDSAARGIFKYSLRDKSLTPFSSFKLGRPTGIAYGRAKGWLYVSDTAEHQVRVIGLDGVERFHFGSRGAGAGQFNYPTDLFVDTKGLLYVTDSLNSRIQIFSAEGKFLKEFGQAGDSSGSFSRPKGVAVDSEGHIYVCDALLDTVQIFDDKGELLLEFGENGTQPGQFWMPSGIYIDSKDYIYVADSYNRRVQVFRYLKLEEQRLNMKNLKPQPTGK